MNKIEYSLFLIKTYADKWHKCDAKLFAYEDEWKTNGNLETWWGFADEFEELLHGRNVKLLYHNYQIWHFIELYTSPDSGTVLFVYDGGIKHNKLRNDSIESIDELLCKNQKGTGKTNSETVGSIIDRIGILYIKLLHLKDAQDKRVDLIQQQFDMLVNCASELMDDMENGERQCMPFSRFKIEYSGQ